MKLTDPITGDKPGKIEEIPRKFIIATRFTFSRKNKRSQTLLIRISALKALSSMIRCLQALGGHHTGRKSRKSPSIKAPWFPGSQVMEDLLSIFLALQLTMEAKIIYFTSAKTQLFGRLFTTKISFKKKNKIKLSL